MKTYAASQARNNLKTLITESQEEPIAITKDGKEVAVIVSVERFTELQYLENTILAKAAEMAIQEGLANSEDVATLMAAIGGGNA